MFRRGENMSVNAIIMEEKTNSNEYGTVNGDWVKRDLYKDVNRKFYYTQTLQYLVKKQKYGFGNGLDN